MRLWRALAAFTLLCMAAAGDDRAVAEDAADDDRIAELESEVRRLRAVEQRFGRQRRGMLADLEDAARSIAIADRELEILRVKLARSEVEARRLERELERAEAGRDSERAALRALLRAAHERRVPNALAVLLQGSRDQSIERSLLQLERLSAAEVEAVARYQREEAAIRVARERLAAERLEQAGLESDLAARRRSSEASHAEKARALAALEGRSAEATEELREAARRLRQLVGNLGAEPPPGTEPVHTDFDSRRGKLPWPVDGSIRRRFGLERHPRLNTLIEYQGVEIAARGGSPIRAVHTGRVAFADLFAAYGLLVIVDHGDGYYSLYANLADTAVSAGKSVAAGDVLGTLAEASDLGASGLRFELHKGAQAFNPEPWLARP